MATHSSVLAWRIPGTGEPDGLPSLGSHRVKHDWSDLAAAAANQIYQCILILTDSCGSNNRFSCELTCSNLPLKNSFFSLFERMRITFKKAVNFYFSFLMPPLMKVYAGVWNSHREREEGEFYYIVNQGSMLALWFLYKCTILLFKEEATIKETLNTNILLSEQT